MISTIFSLVRRLYVYNQNHDTYFDVNNKYVANIFNLVEKENMNKILFFIN
jgi:hypothetical protein